MKCPYCSHPFHGFDEGASKMPESVPVLCQQCLGVSLFENGGVREISATELGELQKDHDWAATIVMAVDIIKRIRSARNAYKN